jgi:NADH pyrophosphatase NudC (nudix superfamily)
MGIFGKIKEGASKAADLAKETVEVNRLNGQISGKKKDIDKNHYRIGELVYNAYLASDLTTAEEDIALICKEIENSLADIRQFELKILEAKSEKYCTCGKLLAIDTKFCPACGHKFEVIEGVES